MLAVPYKVKAVLAHVIYYLPFRGFKHSFILSYDIF